MNTPAQQTNTSINVLFHTFVSYHQICQAVSVPHATQRDQRPTTQTSLLVAAGKVKRPSRLKMFLEKKRQAKLARIPKTLDTSAQVDGIP